MLNVNEFYNELIKNKFDMFCGVPDSLLKDFSSYLQDYSGNSHIIAVNEGNALAIASGYYLATGKSAVVYMQNSGLGNIVNPLLSLNAEDVYNIPALLIIGWRGEPTIKDEPQHIKQGRLTLPLLDTMEIKYEILENIKQIATAKEYINKTNRPFAFIVRKGTFTKYSSKEKIKKYNLRREDAIKKIITLMHNDDIVVSTTGMISREIYANRLSHEKDFLTIGSMGYASSIALGIAILKPHRKIFCFDGDGAFLMHMGALTIIASKKLQNFKHIVLNNEAYDSVGGQPSSAGFVSLPLIAKACGYQDVFECNSLEDIDKYWNSFYNNKTTSLLEVKVSLGARDDLERPEGNPIDNKKMFMDFIK